MDFAGQFKLPAFASLVPGNASLVRPSKCPGAGNVNGVQIKQMTLLGKR